MFSAYMQEINLKVLSFSKVSASRFVELCLGMVVSET
jgi:hypothetical protein